MNRQFQITLCVLLLLGVSRYACVDGYVFYLGAGVITKSDFDCDEYIIVASGVSLDGGSGSWVAPTAYLFITDDATDNSATPTECFWGLYVFQGLNKLDPYTEYVYTLAEPFNCVVLYGSSASDTFPVRVKGLRKAVFTPSTSGIVVSFISVGANSNFKKTHATTTGDVAEAVLHKLIK